MCPFWTRVNGWSEEQEGGKERRRKRGKGRGRREGERGKEKERGKGRERNSSEIVHSLESSIYWTVGALGSPHTATKMKGSHMSVLVLSLSSAINSRPMWVDMILGMLLFGRNSKHSLH